MKKFLLLSTSAITLIGLASPTIAQNILTISKPDADVTVTNDNVEGAPQLIELEIITDENTGQTTAKLIGLERKAEDLGLHKLMLEGQVIQKGLGNGRKEVSILWSEASILDEETREKNQRPLTNHLHPRSLLHQKWRVETH